MASRADWYPLRHRWYKQGKETGCFLHLSGYRVSRIHAPNFNSSLGWYSPDAFPTISLAIVRGFRGGYRSAGWDRR